MAPSPEGACSRLNRPAWAIDEVYRGSVSVGLPGWVRLACRRAVIAGVHPFLEHAQIYDAHVVAHDDAVVLALRVVTGQIDGEALPFVNEQERSHVPLERFPVSGEIMGSLGMLIRANESNRADFAAPRSRRRQRLRHRFGVPRDHRQQGSRRLIGIAPLLLPIPHQSSA